MIAIVTALLVSGGVLWLFAGMANNDSRNIRLGDAAFKVGGSKRLAARVAKEGPIFFNDLVREDNLRRPLVLAHVGGNDWAALNALPSKSASEDCIVSYDEAAKQFVDPCTKDRYEVDGRPTTNPNGLWLARFETEVDAKGALIINLNSLYPQQLRER